MKFDFLKNGWDLNEWQNKCPELTHKVVGINDLPNWLPSGLTSKFNSAVIASSGNLVSKKYGDGCDLVVLLSGRVAKWYHLSHGRSAAE